MCQTNLQNHFKHCMKNNLILLFHLFIVEGLERKKENGFLFQGKMLLKQLSKKRTICFQSLYLCPAEVKSFLDKNAMSHCQENKSRSQYYKKTFCLENLILELNS